MVKRIVEAYSPPRGTLHSHRLSKGVKSHVVLRSDREGNGGKTIHQLCGRTVIDNAVVCDSPYSLGERIHFHTSTDEVWRKRSENHKTCSLKRTDCLSCPRHGVEHGIKVNEALFELPQLFITGLRLLHELSQ